MGKGKAQKLNNTQKKVWINEIRNLNHTLSQKLNKLLCSQAKSYGPSQIGIEMCFQFVFAAQNDSDFQMLH